MTATDHLDRAVSHLAAAKAYAVSPRYVVEGVAELSDALMALEAARGLVEAMERECAELRREVGVYRTVNHES